MSQKNSNKVGLPELIRDGRIRAENPVANKIESGIYKAITVGIPDPEGRGRVSAYIPRLGGNPDNYQFFEYASPFGGQSSGSSYGFFAAPPDANLTILVLYADNGDMREGYWFAVLPQVPTVASGGALGTPHPDQTTGIGVGAFASVPAAKDGRSTLKDAQQGPDAFNGDNPPTYGPGNLPIPPEGGNSARNSNTANQGTFSDPLRGGTTASPARDASYSTPQHSKVFGMVTPGQSALTFDDGSVDDQGTIHPTQIRITTGNGGSVILDGTNDFIYIVNSSGTGWVEVGADGEVSIYAKGSLSVRAEKDINFRADENINFDAGQKVNIRSGSDTMLTSAGQTHMHSAGNQFFQTEGSNHTKVGANMYATTGGVMHLNGPAATAAQKVSGVSMPDIKGHESTETPNVSVPMMPSSEPYLRQSPPNTGGGSIVPDPASYSSQASALNSSGGSSSGNTGENGRLDTSTLKSIGSGHMLRPDAADAYLRMVEAARSDGITWSITDSYRTYDAQVRLAQEKGLYSQGGLAATPGTSNHGWGTALDLGGGANSSGSPQNNWLQQNAGRFGFRNIPREPWHWQYT